VLRQERVVKSVLGIPVFNTPQEAVSSLGNIDISVLFCASGRCEGGSDLPRLLQESNSPFSSPIAFQYGTPWKSQQLPKANGAMFLGPNTLGVLSPGQAVVGMIGGRAESARQWFKPGIRRSRSHQPLRRHGFQAAGYYLGQAGVRLFNHRATSVATPSSEFGFPMLR